MKENILLLSKIGGKSALRWLLIVVLGSILSSIYFILALSKYSDLFPNSGGHAGISALWVFLVNLFSENFFAFIIIFGFPVFIVIYFILANKSFIQNLIFGVWNEKLGETVSNWFETKTTDFLTSKNISGQTTKSIKSGLRKYIRIDNGASRVVKRVASFGLKKINLNDINLTGSAQDISSSLSNKLTSVISETTKPSNKIFWMLILFQTICFVLAMF